MSTALVTGACKGLGSYLAGRLADEGWTVVAVGRCPEDAAPFAEKVDYIQADLSDPEVLDSLPLRLDPVPDLVVHCAVAYPEQEERGPTPKGIEEVFRVNALAPYLLTLALLERKQADRFSSHIVVNSEAIYAADHHSAVYASTKAALRVLTTGLAEGCRSSNASVATLLLGPLEDTKKLAQAEVIAERKGMSTEEVVRLFLRRSNPNLVIEKFIDYESCFRSVQYMADLGPTANGMLCKLDGGSSGSLV